MKYIKTLLSLVLVGFSLSASAQCTDPDACNFNETTVNDVCLSLETVQVHTTGDLAGQTTYRLYVNFPADDTYYIGSISGDGDTTSNIQPLNISTTTDFYQDPVGSLTANGINPSAFSSFPTLEYDSWITVIGEDNTFATQVSTVGEGWIANFEAGGDIVINSQEGGAWYILNNVDNGQSVSTALIAQLTTDGTISGQVTVNYFAPELGYSLQSTLSLDNACEYGQCVYPEAYLTCDGDCVTDTDSDGICDEFEVVGCTDITACNYTAIATDSNQSLCDFSCVSAIVVSEACDNETTINYNGQDYDLVEIDGRCWFAEDLRTTQDRNGTTIPEITEEGTWAALGTNDGARTTYFANSGNSISEVYRSYNWYAVETGLLCPTGWHVANNKDWNSLESTVFGARGQNLSSANRLVVGNTQELHDLGWFSQYVNDNVFSDIVFSGGLRTNVDGKWKDDEGSMYWWTAEDYNGRGSNGNRKNSAWARGVKKDASWGRFKDLWSTSGSKNNALRVRCVKGDNTPENIVLNQEPVFFFASGPITNGTTDPDAEVNLQDTVYIDANRTAAPAGYFFANGKGETFVTNKRGVLISADGYKLGRDQKIMTIGDSDILDSAFGAGRPMVTCACCCYAGQNYYMQDFVIRSPRGGCGAFCNNQLNCESLQSGLGGQDLCWEDVQNGIADTYLDGYVKGGWNPKEYRRFEQVLDLVGFEIIDPADPSNSLIGDPNDPNPYLEIRAGAVIQPVLNEENTYTNQQLKDGLSFTKGFIFTFEDKWYKVNDSWILEGGGDNPLPEWGAGGGPQDLHCCACWQEAPDCVKHYDYASGRKGKNCTKLCAPSSTVFPGSPPCEGGGGGATAPDPDEFSIYSKFGPIVKFNGDNPVFRNLNDAANYGQASGLRGIQQVVAPSYVYSEELDSTVVANANSVGFMAGDPDEEGFSFGAIELEWSYDIADLLGRSKGDTRTFYGPSFITLADKVYLDADKNIDTRTFYIRQHGGAIYKVENVSGQQCTIPVTNRFSEEEIDDIIANNPNIGSEIIISDLDSVADKKTCRCERNVPTQCPDDTGDNYYIVVSWYSCPGLVPCAACCAGGRLIGKGGMY